MGATTGSRGQAAGRRAVRAGRRAVPINYRRTLHGCIPQYSHKNVRTITQ
jgi:hypothetical protein